jgi:hypothetical protein
MPTAARIKGTKNAKPDEKIRREMKQIDDEMHETAVKFRTPQSLIEGPGDKEGLGHAFPARLTAYDPDDDRVEMKINAPGAFGQKTLQDSDLEWIKRKKQNAQYAEFVNWCETYYDMRDPAIQVRGLDEYNQLRANFRLCSASSKKCSRTTSSAAKSKSKK